MAPTFQLLQTFEERIQVYELYTQLNPNLSRDEFESRMKAIMHEKGYQLLGMFLGEKLVGISGFWLATKLYCGKYMEPDNVVVDENHRSAGLGEKLQQELEQIARKNNCNVMMLDAYLTNEPGHKFYERNGYQKKGYHFIKKL
jgi:GNAT superfamily N-acetyltransferase